jgi:hypothetical protein
VTVNEEPLEVYGVEEKDGKTVAYIEAKEGQRFKTAYYDARLSQEIQDAHIVRMHLDGIRYALDNVRDPLFDLFLPRANGVILHPSDDKFAVPAHDDLRTHIFGGADDSAVRRLSVRVCSVLMADCADHTSPIPLYQTVHY